MSSFEKKYFELFNRVSNIIEELKKIQIEAEEMYIKIGEELFEPKLISHTEK